MSRCALVPLAALVGAFVLGCASAPPPVAPAPLRQEARAALEVGAARFEGRHFAAAARSFGRAAAIFGALDDPASEATALRNQAEALRRDGDLAAAAAGFERALALDAASGRSVAQARDLVGLARVASASGEAERAIGDSERALQLVPDADPFRATVEIDLAVYLLARGAPGDRERVFALLTAAAGRAAARDDPSVHAVTQLQLGRAQRHFGSADLGEAALLRALEVFRALDDPEGVARSHEELGRLMGARAESAAARRHLEQARRGYEFLGDAAALRSVDALLAEGRE